MVGRNGYSVTRSQSNLIDIIISQVLASFKNKFLLKGAFIMRKNIENITEAEEIKEINTETKETENFATEVFRAFQAHSRFVTRGLVIALITSSVIWAVLYYRNDKEWRDLFNSYDFITQDGEGVNNVNSGWQGDLNNNPGEE